MLLRALLAFCLLAPLPSPAADLPLEIIELRHRQAEDVLPALRPLVAPGGSVSGLRHKLFIRSTAENLAQLRAVLSELDLPAARLLISVRQSSESLDDRFRAEVHGRIGDERVRIERPPPAGVPRSPGATVSIGDGRREEARQVVQQVQTIDGGQAYIHAGVSLPVPLRRLWLTADGAVLSDTVIWRDLGTGFNAVPRIAGDRVSIEISPYDERPLSADGTAEIRRLSTTVEGRLGEWIALGGSTQDISGARLGILSRDADEMSRRNVVWLKVERLD